MTCSGLVTSCFGQHLLLDEFRHVPTYIHLHEFYSCPSPQLSPGLSMSAGAYIPGRVFGHENSGMSFLHATNSSPPLPPSRGGEESSSPATSSSSRAMGVGSIGGLATGSCYPLPKPLSGVLKLPLGCFGSLCAPEVAACPGSSRSSCFCFKPRLETVLAADEMHCLAYS